MNSWRNVNNNAQSDEADVEGHAKKVTNVDDEADVEGHRGSGWTAPNSEDADVEGHGRHVKIQNADDADVNGHLFIPNMPMANPETGDDDVEGHKKKLHDDDDVEGHRRR